MAIKQRTRDALVGTSANRETVYHVQLQNDHTSAKNTNRRQQQSKFNKQKNEEIIDLVTGVAAQPEIS